MLFFRTIVLSTINVLAAANAYKVGPQSSEDVLEKSLRAAIQNGNVTEIPPNFVTWSDGERYGHRTVGPYVLYNDVWNEPLGQGSQCVGSSTIDPTSWFSKWSWKQKSTQPQVISYANMEFPFAAGAAIGKFESLKSSWHATYTGHNMSSNVAFDMFIRPPGSGDQVEIMAWIKEYGVVSPISSSGGPIASIQLPSGIWALYKGHNDYSHMDVYSFVISTASIGGPIRYDGDLLEFLHHLIRRGAINDNWQLIKIGAGTETTVGRDCFFFTSHYSLTPVMK
ncbi:Probable xyloglucan-specific endo-beta-1,4-glucanase A [Taphrina deformans PYCC 5710]|uniref:Probable xyloglucan-specific endo-beta-1,4-glucanase A n=1 Tax=Taphrina deformans (strain PYCC 5710 / ATCC 11124 / CBS 356.35 / IMI 108563 / JCM 9778 / NBRC 8474) TaxID=1097556 RepID=R4XA13_TAPDE|nr:Probable xyloglucan-specific endo-beta-1,4-glucanase A [Taphrina deformans PYCC 5710]|eukprot:CCG81104.1 Probable xyloglucan-specific endo-beta-1,4-glucanase A [Taphrina deformans PYCC 5710]